MLSTPVYKLLANKAKAKLFETLQNLFKLIFWCFVCGQRVVMLACFYTLDDYILSQPFWRCRGFFLLYY